MGDTLLTHQSISQEMAKWWCTRLVDAFKCEMLKKWLKSRDLEFIEKNLDDVNVMTDLIMRNAVVLSAPVLEVEDALFTEDQIFDDNGLIKDELLAILEEAI